MLTDQRIEELCADLRNTVGCSNTTLARAIEAEVSKQDTELIRQMLEALQTCVTGCDYLTEVVSVTDAITSARARLEPKP